MNLFIEIETQLLLEVDGHRRSASDPSQSQKKCDYTVVSLRTIDDSEFSNLRFKQIS